MSSVGGAAWKTEEETAAHMETVDHMEIIREEDRREAICQDGQELRQTVRVCGGKEKDSA